MNCKQFQAALYEEMGACVDTFFVKNFQTSGKSKHYNNAKAVSDNLKEYGLRKRVCFNDQIRVHEQYSTSRWIVHDSDQSELGNEDIYDRYKASGGTWFIMEKQYFLDHELNQPSKFAIWYQELNKQYGDKVVIETNITWEES